MRLKLFRPTARLALACIALGGLSSSAAPVEATAENQLSVVRVNVTSQSYDFFRPWSKRAPYSRRALGAVLGGGRVLVTGELVANATYVELEKAESGEKTAATVETVDYDANLAVVKPVTGSFLDGLRPLQLSDAAVGDTAQVWQLEATGALLSTSALVTTIEVTRYPAADISLLVYRLTASLQYREGSFTMPVVRNGQLVGLLMRYDARAQNADIIPAPVIEYFLKSAAGGKYAGFPRAGIQFAPMRDPQLRRHAGLKNGAGGVFVTEVLKDGPGAKAGIRSGDVLLELDGIALDQDGNYRDPRYGKLSLVHLVTTRRQPGDKVKAVVLREGKAMPFEITLTHQPAEDLLIPPYVMDSAPAYLVLGGLVFQELSRQYLREWGNDWQKQAPQRLVYYERYYQDIFQDDRKRLILLSQVLPTPDTIGYEQLAYLVVTRINDVEIKSIEDVAAAVAKPLGGFHRIEFKDDPKVIYLDAAQVEANETTLMSTYGLPNLRRLPGPAHRAP